MCVVSSLMPPMVFSEELLWEGCLTCFPTHHMPLREMLMGDSFGSEGLRVASSCGST